MLILVTGATGKVGRHFIDRLLADKDFAGAKVRALCHNRVLDETDRIEVMRGSIADREVAEAAIAGVTHVLHLATPKETPEVVIDVTVKGLFWLLEAFRESPAAKQFILIGGDAAIGHFFWRREAPLTEATPHAAYPGCYALSKVLEEVVLEQFGIQYDLNVCCLRAPWIMEKDDFKASLSFGDDLFGGPDWKTMVPAADAARYARDGTVPLLRDADGRPLRRNFVHVDDLASAILAAIDNPRAKRELFNICMDRPVDYGEVAEHLKRTRGLGSVDIPSEYHSTWLDNAKARNGLDWQPRYDLARLIDAAYDYPARARRPAQGLVPGVGRATSCEDEGAAAFPEWMPTGRSVPDAVLVGVARVEELGHDRDDPVALLVEADDGAIAAGAGSAAVDARADFPELEIVGHQPAEAEILAADRAAGFRRVEARDLGQIRKRHGAHSVVAAPGFSPGRGLAGLWFGPRASRGVAGASVTPVG